MSCYPDEPAPGQTDTSAEGAEKVRDAVPALQRDVTAVIASMRDYGATADEVAAKLGWDRFRVRPRASELRALGKIVDSGRRRKNAASGVSAIVWVLPEYVAADRIAS